MKKSKTPSRSSAIREASARHFCDGMDDGSYLSMRFHFAEDAVKKATDDAAVCRTALARLFINDRGETVSTVAGELFTYLEHLDRYQFNYEERLSDALYYWFYFVRQFAIPFLGKKKAVSVKLGMQATSKKFGHIMGQLTNMVSTMRKTINVNRQDPETHKSYKEKETFIYFNPQVPIFQFRAKGEELFFEEEQATKELLDQPHIKRKRRKCHLTDKQISDNIKKNELITEIRRRAKSKFGSLGEKNIRKAYEELSEEAMQAGSKWRSVIGLVSDKTILNMAQHNRKYKTSQTHNAE